jgi:hypothetical protein
LLVHDALCFVLLCFLVVVSCALLDRIEAEANAWSLLRNGVIRAGSAAIVFVCKREQQQQHPFFSTAQQREEEEL